MLKVARDIGVRGRRQDEERQKLLQQRGDVQTASPRERFEVRVEVELAEDGEIEMDVTYALPGAQWQPLYDIRLINEQICVTYLAEVQQNTGEDWSNVELTLSTIRPSESVEIPHLEPWFFNNREASGRERTGYLGLDSRSAVQSTCAKKLNRVRKARVHITCRRHRATSITTAASWAMAIAMDLTPNGEGNGYRRDSSGGLES